MRSANYAKSTWRLIKTPPGHGAWNMAVDEAILESISSGISSPTLRLYDWDPPCLSLGYAQSFSDVDLEVLSNQGWDVVRRITGGRAILHTDELTYSVIAPIDEPRVSGNVLESYRKLSQALLNALHIMGLPAKSLPETKALVNSKNKQEPVCFEIPSNYEITLNGKKLIGSAQARKKNIVLQHGSLPLSGDLTRITQTIQFPDQDSRLKAAYRLLERATTVEAESDIPISWDQAASAFTASFSDVLNLSLREESLSPSETERADKLVKEKYAHPDWTERI